MRKNINNCAQREKAKAPYHRHSIITTELDSVHNTRQKDIIIIIILQRGVVLARSGVAYYYYYYYVRIIYTGLEN